MNEIARPRLGRALAFLLQRVENFRLQHEIQLSLYRKRAEKACLFYSLAHCPSKADGLDAKLGFGKAQFGLLDLMTLSSFLFKVACKRNFQAILYLSDYQTTVCENNEHYIQALDIEYSYLPLI